MNSESSRTYDTKDAIVGGNDDDDDVAATTATTATTTITNAAAATVVADVNESDEQSVNTNNQSEFEQIDKNNNNNNNKEVDEQDKEADEAYSVDILLNAQLCNSYSKVELESVFNKEKLMARTKFLNTIDTNLDLLSKNIKCLNHRCEQFNDVKLSIKQTNDLIRDDLYSNFGTITFLMRIKLKEMSDCVKEKLKDAYSVVRDTKSKVKALTDQIRTLRNQLESLGIKLQSSHDLGQELPFSVELDKDELGKHKAFFFFFFLQFLRQNNWLKNPFQADESYF
jgi:hypothetical protein